MLATFLVTSSADSGAGTLRQAILDANSSQGADAIEFALPAGDRVISPLSALPLITDQVNLDARTQDGFDSVPLIELSGENLTESYAGLDLRASNSLIAGFVIHSFPSFGINVSSGNTNEILQNYVGTNPAGDEARPNGLSGISLYESSYNVIGGPDSGNLLSGNGWEGLRLTRSHSNTVQGNRVGVNVDGESAVPNELSGILLYDSNGNTVGSDRDGSNDAAERNHIAGNKGDGIRLRLAMRNSIAGNWIGATAEGTTALPNLNGILVGKGSFFNSIRSNVIVGNLESGVSLVEARLTTIAANSIGVVPQADGAFALGNGEAGIHIGIESLDTTVGGSTVSGRNVVSANRIGIVMDGSSESRIEGNLIGTDPSGLEAMPNSEYGIRLLGGASENTIGPQEGTRFEGIPNVISGNGNFGIRMDESTDNHISFNYIGVGVDGMTPIPNETSGILLDNDSDNNVIGTDVAQADFAAKNVISGNGQYGVWIYDSDNVVVSGNLIGVGKDGRTKIGNVSHGVLVGGFSENTRIGRNTEQYSTESLINVISGNGNNGIRVENAVSPVVAGNYLGTDLGATQAVGNGRQGIITMQGTTSPKIESNTIGGNGFSGVYIFNSTGAHVYSNYVGVSEDNVLLPNSLAGVRLGRGATESVVGHKTALPNNFQQANVIGGNTQAGVWIDAENTSQNVVAGNYIGTNKTQDLALPNLGNGITVENSASANRIGGSLLTEVNYIAYNGGYGIAFAGGANANTVAGNKIGVLDSANAPNSHGGISIDESSDNRIESSEVPNIIHSLAEAVRITGETSQGNVNSNTEFRASPTLVDLGADGATPNDPLDADTGPNDLQNFPEFLVAATFGGLTQLGGVLNSIPSQSFEVEVAELDAANNLTTVGVTQMTTDSDGEGYWFLKLTTGVPQDRQFLVSARNSNGSQSEWSPAFAVTDLVSMTVFSASIREGTPGTTVELKRPPETLGDLEFSLVASDSSQINVPETIVIPADQQSVVFRVEAIDDEIHEPTVQAQVFITHAQREFEGLVALDIIDDDPTWHNMAMPLDVNADDAVSAIDALLIINFLNERNDSNLQNQQAPNGQFHIDVNNDGFASAIDALTLINALNTQNGEGESADIRNTIFVDWEWLQEDLLESRL
ncbi:MAG: right-handed parallel beta-helix repeat-containing protein [Planctomycetota bacterium]